ncbi:MAG: serine hydrolase [Clostridia bacterium]|nr:serine hydrolase [Clostridia bacterium]
MPDEGIKISQLTPASSIADTDLIPKENAGGTSTEAATAAQLANYFKSKGVQVDNTLSTPGAAADAAKTGAEVTDLKNAIDFEKIIYTPGRAIVTNVGDGNAVNLTTVPGGSQNCAVVDCEEGNLFTITGTGGSSYRLWCFIDSYNIALETSKVGVTGNNLVIVAPKNAAKLILNNTNTEESYKGIVVDKKVVFIEDSILHNDGTKYLRFSTSSYCLNCATDLSSLNPTQTSSVYRFCLVSASAGDLFTITCTGGVSPQAYAFINNNLEILENAGQNVTLTDHVIKAPANTAYLIINDGSGTGYAFKGITGKAYKKYINDVIKIPDSPVSDSAAVSAFVARMNVFAAQIGMANSTFVNPSGLGTSNSVEILDVMKMGLIASSYREILQMWSLRSASVVVGSTETSVTNSYLDYADQVITNANVLGGKGGSIGDQYRTQIDIVDISGKTCILCLCGMNATDYGQIYTYANDLAGMLADEIENGSYTVPTHSGGQDLAGLVSRGGAYAAMVIPDGNPSAYSGNYSTTKLKARDHVIVDGENNACVPCSITKVLSAMVTLDVLPDLNAIIEIHSSDLVGGSGISLSAGDKISAKDALVLALINSNNAAATALGRTAGRLLVR